MEKKVSFFYRLKSFQLFSIYMYVFKTLYHLYPPFQTCYLFVFSATTGKLPAYSSLALPNLTFLPSNLILPTK